MRLAFFSLTGQYNRELSTRSLVLCFLLSRSLVGKYSRG